MVRPYFAFKNINCMDYGIYVREMPPEENGEDEFEIIEVPGRDGYLSIDLKRKKPIVKPIEGTFLENEYRNIIKRWLQGEGKLILSTEPDVYYKARIIKPIQYVGTYYGGRKFKVDFVCQPWGYLISGENTITITVKNTSIHNPETLSKPLIKIYGAGAVDLIINSNIHKFNITDYVTIDSELMGCYKDNTLATFTGEFPELLRWRK